MRKSVPDTSIPGMFGDLGTHAIETASLPTRQDRSPSNLWHETARNLTFAGAAALSEPFGYSRRSEFDFRPISTAVHEESQNECERDLVLSLYRQLSSIDWSMLEPGNRTHAFAFLEDDLHKYGPSVFSALQGAMTAQSSKFGDALKASIIRSIGLLFEGDRSSVPFLVSRLGDTSPSQAHAAALALGEVADRYSLPALHDALSKMKWPSAKRELRKTIEEIERKGS